MYKLVIGKGGTKLKKSNADDPGPLRIAPGVLAGTSTPIAVLATLLGRQLRRTVIDDTGLKGRFDFELNYSLELGQNDSLTPTERSTPADSDAPFLFTALQDRLGLKLEPTKGPAGILVIDHIEKPSVN
jgi:uncharacterized protein (TIGR03435 family)